MNSEDTVRFSNFQEILDRVRENGTLTISIAAAQDEEALACAKAALEQGIANSILVGDEALLKPLVKEIGLPENIRLIHEPDPMQAARKAVSLVRNGEADVLLKGRLNTSDYLKAVVDKEYGLRKGRLLSHLAAYEAQGHNKLFFATDTGMNISPNLEEKKEILVNALEALEAFSINYPKIAILSANERVNAKMQSTVDAKALVDFYKDNIDFKGIIEGPISMDVAVSFKAAEHKGIKSDIAEDVDLFVFPNLDAGNIWSKALTYYAGFKMSGVILGATNPVVLVSRADNAETKLNSIAMACMIAFKNKISTKPYTGQ